MSVSGWALESQTLFNLQVSPAHQCDAHGRLTLVARVTGNSFVMKTDSRNVAELWLTLVLNIA